MRIGFDAKRAFLNNTGLGNYSRDTIRILSNFYSENKYFLYTPSKNKNTKIGPILERENTHICTPKSLMNKTFQRYWRSKNIVQDLLNNRIEIYHGLSNEIPLGIEKTSIKTIVSIHDLIFVRYPKLFNAIDRKIYYKKFESSCRRANKIIAVSQQTKKDIIDFFKIPEDKISVVYQGCNTIFKKSIPIKNRMDVLQKHKIPTHYLLYVGSIEERKNLLTILKTLKELPNQKLVVIGEGKEYKFRCVKFITANNLSNRVMLLKNLSNHELAAIYQSAQIMIYPSIFEGFGIPILESLFSKIPVITSKEGCFSEAGGKYSKYIDPLSVNQMSKAIKEIQASTKLRSSMIQKGFDHAQDFTDKNISTNLIKIYNKL